jgi:hypothetical protein
MSDQELSELAAAWDEIGDAFASAEKFGTVFFAFVRGQECAGLCSAASQFSRQVKHEILLDIDIEFARVGRTGGYLWPLGESGRDARVEFCRRMAKQYRERMEAAK